MSEDDIEWPAPTSLLGNSQVESLALLRREYEEVVRVATPRMVNLEGEVGVGKTFVVHEFFRSLSRTQPGPAYWPQDIIDPALPASDQRSRGYPAAWTVAAGARIPWLWLAVDADLSRGVLPGAAMMDLRAQYDAHATAIDLVATSTSRALTRAAVGMTPSPEPAVDAAALGGASSTLVDIASSALDAWGVVRSVTGAVRRSRSEFNARRQAMEERQLSGGTNDITRLRSELIAEIVSASKELPTILVVDNSQRSTPDLDYLIGEVLRFGEQVLVVTVGWPNTWDTSELSEICSRLTEHRSSRSFRELKSPDAEILSSIVRSSAPATNSTTIEMLVEKYSNPLALHTFLNLESTRQSVNEDALELDAEQLASSSRSIRDLLMERWSRLEPDVRRYLALAAGLHGRVFIPSIIDEIFNAATGQARPPDLLTKLPAVRKSADGDYWAVFDEELWVEVAQERINEIFTASDLQAGWDRIVSLLADDAIDLPGPALWSTKVWLGGAADESDLADGRQHASFLLDCAFLRFRAEIGNGDQIGSARRLEILRRATTPDSSERRLLLALVRYSGDFDREHVLALADETIESCGQANLETLAAARMLRLSLLSAEGPERARAEFEMLRDVLHRDESQQARLLELSLDSQRRYALNDHLGACLALRRAAQFADNEVTEAALLVQAVNLLMAAVQFGEREPDRRTALHVARWADRAFRLSMDVGPPEVFYEAALFAVAIRYATEDKADLMTSESTITFAHPREETLRSIAIQHGTVARVAAADLFLRSVQVVDAFARRNRRHKMRKLLSIGQEVFGPDEERFVMLEAQILTEQLVRAKAGPRQEVIRKLRSLVDRINDRWADSDPELALMRDTILYLVSENPQTTEGMEAAMRRYGRSPW